MHLQARWCGCGVWPESQSHTICLAELLPYTTRHVQQHAARLNLTLRPLTDSPARWVEPMTIAPVVEDEELSL